MMSLYVSRFTVISTMDGSKQIATTAYGTKVIFTVSNNMLLELLGREINIPLFMRNYNIF